MAIRAQNGQSPSRSVREGCLSEGLNRMGFFHWDMLFLGERCGALNI